MGLKQKGTFGVKKTMIQKAFMGCYGNYRGSISRQKNITLREPHFQSWAASAFP
jgi:hypothetical protein